LPLYEIGGTVEAGLNGPIDPGKLWVEYPRHPRDPKISSSPGYEALYNRKGET